MKIACVGYLHGSGGAERQIIMLANAMAARGHDVSLIVLAQFNARYEISDKVTVYDLTASEEKEGNKILTRYQALKKALCEISPDVSVHYWLQSTYLTAMMPKSICGKIIYSERGDPGDAEYDGLLGMIRTAAFLRVDGFVFQSKCARDYFGKRVAKKSSVIHNSVAVPQERYTHPCTRREKRIVTVGRLHAQKNQRLLIEAFSKIATEFPEHTLEIYGDGELRDKLESQIKSLGLEERVVLLNSRKDIFDWIYPASLFVLTSDYEGMPNTLMEAMALGIPNISTDWRPGAASEFIQDGVNGLIVPCGDSAALADRMQFVLLNENAAEQIAAEAQKLRETHTQERIFNLWEQVIFKVVGLRE